MHSPGLAENLIIGWYISKYGDQLTGSQRRAELTQ